jgi:hypothetical protein
VGSEGMVIRTDNGGKSWHYLSVDTKFDLFAVDFSSATQGLAVGSRGVLFRTNDGGETWLPSNTGAGVNLYALEMLNLLKQAMQQELNTLKPAQGKGKDLLTAELLNLDMSDWYKEARLQELLKKALIKAKIAAGDSPNLAKMAVDAVAADMQSLILEAKNLFKRSRRKQ